MQCELCNKETASILIKRILDDGTTVMHRICEPCSQKYGVNAEVQDSSLIEKLFSAIEAKKSGYSDDIVCFSCGKKLNDVLATNRLGCADCVVYFKTAILDKLNKRIPVVSYSGRPPKQFTILNKPEPEQTITQLRMQLDVAIDNENFELAAYLRDKIKEFEK